MGIALLATGPATLAAQLDGGAASPLVSSGDTDVTVYTATWCGACRTLERELKERKIPYAPVDVDQNPRAFERARRATGESVIPQTSVATKVGMRWIVGADADAVERAYRER
jgi:glutaredoxin